VLVRQWQARQRTWKEALVPAAKTRRPIEATNSGLVSLRVGSFCEVEGMAGKPLFGMH